MCNIKTLQYQVDGLSGLSCLSISACPKLETFLGLENMDSLRMLMIDQCDSLTALPVLALEGLTSLTCLFIDNCSKLRLFSEVMQHLTVLQNFVTSDVLRYKIFHRVCNIWMLSTVC